MIGNSGRKTADIGIVGQVNQLVQRNGSDAVILLDFQKSGKRGSNPRPSAWEADALPTELDFQKSIHPFFLLLCQ